MTLQLLDVAREAVGAKYNENHDPANGQFSSGGSVEGIEEAAGWRGKATPEARARFAEIGAEADALAKRGGLTGAQGEHYESLMREASSLQYDHAQPLDPAKIKSPAERQSTLTTATIARARADLARHKGVYMAISESAAGARFNAETAVDRVMRGDNPKVSPRQFYDTFADTRAAMREQYGDTVTLYRAEGQQREKPTTNWATTREFAANFGGNIVERKVPVEDILAVNVGLGGNYHEVIVGTPPGAKDMGEKFNPNHDDHTGEFSSGGAGGGGGVAVAERPKTSAWNEDERDHSGKGDDFVAKPFLHGENTKRVLDTPEKVAHMQAEVHDALAQWSPVQRQGVEIVIAHPSENIHGKTVDAGTIGLTITELDTGKSTIYLDPGIFTNAETAKIEKLGASAVRTPEQTTARWVIAHEIAHHWQHTSIPLSRIKNLLGERGIKEIEGITDYGRFSGLGEQFAEAVALYAATGRIAGPATAAAFHQLGIDEVIHATDEAIAAKADRGVPDDAGGARAGGRGEEAGEVEGLTGARAATPKAITVDQVRALLDPALWLRLRSVLVPHVAPLFSEAYMTGAMLAAQQRPSRRGVKVYDPSQPRDPGGEGGGQWVGAGEGAGASFGTSDEEWQRERKRGNDRIARAAPEDTHHQTTKLMRSLIPKDITKTERQAVSRYVQDSYSGVNNEDAKGHARTDRKLIDGLLARSTTPTEMRVFRGGNIGGHYVTDLHRLPVGTVLQNTGYTSTTVSELWAKNYGGRSEIIVPKGSHAIAGLAAHPLGHDSQGEVIFPRGSRFEITGFRTESVPVWYGAITGKPSNHIEEKVAILRLLPEASGEKFNPNHDPDDGQFSSGGGVEAVAIERYGLTANYREGAYILRDGRMLNFGEGSTRKGGRVFPFGGERKIDHGDVADLMGSDDLNKGRAAFIEHTGALRLSPEMTAVEVGHKPTPQQVQRFASILHEAGHIQLAVDRGEGMELLDVHSVGELHKALGIHVKEMDEFVEGQRDTGVQPPPSTRIFQRPVTPDAPLPVLPFDFAGVQDASHAVIASYTDSWWAQFTRTTQNALRRILTNALENALTPDQVASQIAPLFGPQRAMAIAVSEVTNLLGLGAQKTYEQAGFGTWEWRTVRDALVDNTCRMRDGLQFSMSVPFERAHVNCRCWPVPVGTPAVPAAVGPMLGLLG